jgi:hypothetical protein
MERSFSAFSARSCSTPLIALGSRGPMMLRLEQEDAEVAEMESDNSVFSFPQTPIPVY